MHLLFRDRIKEDQITTLNTIWIPIYGNVLISTICHNNSDLSISTTLVGKVDTGSERENNSENTASNYTNSNYDINYYLDTICGNVIITTVCDNKSNLSVSSLLIGKVDYN